MRLWLLSLWLMMLPNAPAPSVLAPHGGALWAMAEKTPVDNPIVVSAVPGESEAKALKLPYLLASRTTNYNHATPSQAKNIELVAQRLNGTVVQPGQVFSYYRVVGPYTAENGYGWGRMFSGDRIVPSIGGGVCQGSSTLYSALLRTGLPVLERHQHGLTVPYLPPGEDATVAGTSLNFKFKNNRSTPILITAQAGNRHMTVAIWGATPGPEIVVKHQILAEYPFKTVTKINPRLRPGETKILAPGQKGVKVKNWLEQKTPTGTEIKNLGIDTYRPSPRVIEVGPKVTPEGE
ncbi:vanomycin resistance protein VanB [Sulfobacillus sp. DSM 109850]|uniref:Vanomycin resistance protein VanB n=1 Tax=Sulfobacillus harzensis TaxID=2729629 RepID=A0A7Y0Q262_9FIRM|nr:vanomycin resistance protein VanB [Sulfobacillus harzensis]